MPYVLHICTLFSIIFMFSTFQKRDHHPLVIRNGEKAQRVLGKGGVQQLLVLESQVHLFLV